jgi:hypothetical protein
MFTGFDENPAVSADTSVEFDENPAADAVPQQRERPRIHQRSAVSSNASTNASGDASQRTTAGINDHLAYQPQNDFDNIYIRQEAQSRIRQDCRVDGSCTQRARSDINQSADIDIQGRFTNVFLTQEAAADFEQHCRANGTCNQDTDSDINQQSEFGGHWSSNGFVTRDREETWTRTAGHRH